MNFGAGSLAKSESSMPMRYSLTERLRAEKTQLETRLHDVTKALEALERHPDVMDALEAISRVM